MNGTGKNGRRSTLTKRGRTPKEWIALIEKQDGGKHMHNQLGCIIWWDYYSTNEKASTKSKAFNKFIKAYSYEPEDQVNNEMLHKALVALGYSAKDAKGKTTKRQRMNKVRYNL